MMVLPNEKRERRRGAATVEFALLAPLFLLATMGTIEVTRAVQVKMTLADSVRHALRTGVRPGMDNAAVTQSFNDVLTLNNIKTSDVTLTILVNDKKVDVKTALRNDRITVRAELTLKNVGWVAPMVFAKDAKQSQSLTMLRQ